MQIEKNNQIIFGKEMPDSSMDTSTGKRFISVQGVLALSGVPLLIPVMAFTCL